MTEPSDTAARTSFAPAERATADQILALSKRALDDPILAVVFDAVGGFVMVVNQQRQIIAANEDLLSLLGVGPNDSLLGLRPGEALGCVNATRGPGGCGTSIQCKHCGAVAAILAAQVSDEPIESQCTIASNDQQRPKSGDYRVRITPLTLAGERVYVLVFQDITACKRRELLERAFLHDLGNLLSGLVGWSEELAHAPAPEAATQVVVLAHQLGEQLEEQRELVQAESGGLRLQVEPIELGQLEKNLRACFGAHRGAAGRKLEIQRSAPGTLLYTDPRLLHRVLTNLLKNAFEATQAGGAVTLNIMSEPTTSTFEVHNEGTIPQAIADRLLKQSVTTKGPGRGLGLYSAQLFGEQCLGGQLSFESDAVRGTVFRLVLPNQAKSNSLDQHR